MRESFFFDISYLFIQNCCTVSQMSVLCSSHGQIGEQYCVFLLSLGGIFRSPGYDEADAGLRYMIAFVLPLLEL